MRQGERMARKRAASAVMLLLALGITACAAQGPMTLGGGYEVCTGSNGEKVTFGDVATVSGESTAVVESVELIDAEGLKLRESYIVPIENRTSLGTDAFPPDAQFWDRRITIPGAEVTSGVNATVLLVVEPVGDGDHRAAGYTVRYTAYGRTFESSSDGVFVVASNCARR